MKTKTKIQSKMDGWCNTEDQNCNNSRRVFHICSLIALLTHYNSIIVFRFFFLIQSKLISMDFNLTISECVYLEFIVLYYSDTLIRVENKMKGSSTNQLQTGVYKHTAAQRTLNVLRPMRLDWEQIVHTQRERDYIFSVWVCLYCISSFIPFRSFVQLYQLHQCIRDRVWK